MYIYTLLYKHVMQYTIYPYSGWEFARVSSAHVHGQISSVYKQDTHAQTYINNVCICALYEQPMQFDQTNGTPIVGIYNSIISKA